jgi:predicted DNA-binding mobile mystery protein A
MESNFRDLRLRQLDRSLSAFDIARRESRPHRGWLRAVREALGLSLEDVGRKIGISRSHVRWFEIAEERERITLEKLRHVAEAMDCELVYAIVPKTGTFTDLAERRARSQATEDVLDVEHNMALENQAPGNVKDLIEEETRRRLKRER